MLNRRKFFGISSASLALAATVSPAIGAASPKTRLIVSRDPDGTQMTYDCIKRPAKFVRLSGDLDAIVEYDMRFAEYWRPLRRDLPAREAILKERRVAVEKTMRHRLEHKSPIVYSAGLSELGDAAWGHKFCVAQLEPEVVGDLPVPSPRLFARVYCANEDFIGINIEYECQEAFWWFDSLYRDLEAMNRCREKGQHCYGSDVMSSWQLDPNVAPEQLRGIMGESRYFVSKGYSEYAALREATDCWMYHQAFSLPMESRLML